MGLLDLFKKKQDTIDWDAYAEEQQKNFDVEAYTKYNNEKIREFTTKYDLSTIEGIRSIPISEAKKYPDGGKSVVYMPEQILNRKATEYKKLKQYEMAVECLKKANELCPYSFYAYTRNDYERVVDMMVLGKMFDEAKEEHRKLDYLWGTRLEELQYLQNTSSENDWESKEGYQKRVIDPFLQEFKDREQYYWLLENMPAIAPRSFGAYRRMKNEKTETFKKIVSDVKSNGYDLYCISFWNNDKL